MIGIGVGIDFGLGNVLLRGWAYTLVLDLVRFGHHRYTHSSLDPHRSLHPYPSILAMGIQRLLPRELMKEWMGGDWERGRGGLRRVVDEGSGFEVEEGRRRGWKAWQG